MVRPDSESRRDRENLDLVEASKRLPAEEGEDEIVDVSRKARDRTGEGTRGGWRGGVDPVMEGGFRRLRTL